MASSNDSTNYGLNITESWRAQLGSSNRDDIASAGVVLSNGDLIVAGSSGPPGKVPDDAFATAENGRANFTAYRLDASTGEQLWRWENTTGHQFGDFLFAAGLAGGGAETYAADGGEEFVVLGGSTEGNWKYGVAGGTHVPRNGTAQMAAVKLDAVTGEEIWRFQDGTEDSGNAGRSTGSILGVAGDPDGNFFLVGFVVGRLTSASGAADDRDFFVIKVDGATGDVIWRLQDGTPSDDDVFLAAATDYAGNVIAAGYTLGDYGAEAGGGYDFLAAKFNDDGQELWRYQSGTEQDEAFRALAVDGDGDVYLAGGFGTIESEALTAAKPVVHKLDGNTGEPVWTYDGNTSTNTTFRSVAIDELTGLVVCAGVTDGGWALQSRLHGENDFALALLERDTGQQFGRWHSGSDANDVFTSAGVGADGTVALAGYTYGDWDESGSSGEDADFAAVRFPPFDRDLIAPIVSTGLATPSPTIAEAASPTAPTPAPTRGLRSTPEPTSTADLEGADRSTRGGGSGNEDWLIPVAALGALVGVLLVCGCCCCCFKPRKKSKQRAIKSIGAEAPAPPAPAVSPGAAELAASTSPPPPGYDGALPQSAPTDGNVMTAANDIETRLGNQSSPVSVLPWTPASTIMPGGTVEVAPTAAAKLRAGTAAAAVGAAPGEESCLKEGFAGANGVSGLASPENYERFPQPFSGVNVPVLPYSSSSTVGGDGSNRNSAGKLGEGNYLSTGGLRPEIDVTDLVMDNNDYYDPHVSEKSSTLREAAAAVAVAAAATQAGDKINKKLYYRQASSSGYASTATPVSVFSESDPDTYGDKQLAAMAVATATVKAAAAAAPSSFAGSSEYDADQAGGFASSDYHDTRGGVPANDAGARVQKKGVRGGFVANNGHGAAAFKTHDGRVRELVDGGSIGVVHEATTGNADTGARGAILPTPRSMPALVSMSYSTSMDEGHGSKLSPLAAFDRAQVRQQRQRTSSLYSSDDDAGLPPLPDRGQARQQRQRSSPLYSSEEDGIVSWRGVGGVVRFPFLSNASIGRADGGGGGDSGAISGANLPAVPSFGDRSGTPKTTPDEGSVADGLGLVVNTTGLRKPNLSSSSGDFASLAAGPLSVGTTPRTVASEKTHTSNGVDVKATTAAESAESVGGSVGAEDGGSLRVVPESASKDTDTAKANDASGDRDVGFADKVPFQLSSFASSGSGVRSGGLSSMLACVSGSVPPTPAGGGPETCNVGPTDGVGWWGDSAGGRGGGGGGRDSDNSGVEENGRGEGGGGADPYSGPFFVCGDAPTMSPHGTATRRDDGVGLAASAERWKEVVGKTSQAAHRAKAGIEPPAETE